MVIRALPLPFLERVSAPTRRSVTENARRILVPPERAASTVTGAPSSAKDCVRASTEYRFQQHSGHAALPHVSAQWGQASQASRASAAPSEQQSVQPRCMGRSVASVTLAERRMGLPWTSFFAKGVPFASTSSAALPSTATRSSAFAAETPATGASPSRRSSVPEPSPRPAAASGPLSSRVSASRPRAARASRAASTGESGLCGLSPMCIASSLPGVTIVAERSISASSSNVPVASVPLGCRALRGSTGADGRARGYGLSVKLLCAADRATTGPRTSRNGATPGHVQWAAAGRPSSTATACAGRRHRALARAH
mmetsp:Transcript_99828/g.277797  ORF Transcript_99828/g.277797 Transcript_99828/m.277797 type:complete len:313 (-) Transcript_99828:65-1003(-)